MVGRGQKNQSWSIVIFGYNEEASFPGVIDEVRSILPELTRGAVEIILVDDASTDGPFGRLSNIAKHDPRIRIVRHEINRGIGGALISGYETATQENICAIPADGQIDPRELLQVSVVEENEFVVITMTIAYRSPYRKLLNQLNRIFNRVMLKLKIRDVNWVKIYKRAALQRLELRCHSSIVESEICCKLSRLMQHPREVPSRYRSRVAGVPKGGSVWTLGRAFLDLMPLCLEMLTWHEPSEERQTEPVLSARKAVRRK